MKKNRFVIAGLLLAAFVVFGTLWKALDVLDGGETIVAPAATEECGLDEALEIAAQSGDKTFGAA